MTYKKLKLKPVNSRMVQHFRIDEKSFRLKKNNQDFFLADYTNIFMTILIYS